MHQTQSGLTALGWGSQWTIPVFSSEFSPHYIHFHKHNHMNEFESVHLHSCDPGLFRFRAGRLIYYIGYCGTIPAETGSSQGLSRSIQYVHTGVDILNSYVIWVEFECGTRLPVKPDEWDHAV